MEKYKPKYETTFSGIAKQNPISSVVSMGIIPAIGSLAGKAIETGRAMFSDTGDPMAMVKGRTQQMAGELSDYTNGQAGKPTITNLSPPAPVNRQPISALPANYDAMRNKFIADEQAHPAAPMVSGSTEATPVAPSDTTAAAAIPATPASQTPEATGAKSPGVTAPDMQTAGERIYEYKTPGITDISENSLAAGLTGDNAAFDSSRKQDMQSGISTPLTPQEIQSYNIGSNGGIATMDGKTFVLPSRGAKEEQQFQAQQTQAQAMQPITAIGAAAPQTSTIGYGHGVFELAPGQNAPPDYSKMTLGEAAMAKFQGNREAKQAQANYHNAAAKNLSDEFGLKATEHPFMLAGKAADIGYKTAETNKINTMTPLEASGMKVRTDNAIGEGTRKTALFPGELAQQGEEIKATQAKANHFNSLADYEKYKATPEGQRAMKAAESKPDSPLAIFKAAHEHAYESVKDMGIPDEQKAALTEKMFWQNTKRYADLAKAMQGGQPQQRR